VVPSASAWLVASAKIAGATFAPDEPKLYSSFMEIVDERPMFDAVVINVPVGYLDSEELHLRTCDQMAKELLGPRGNVIMHTPSRAAIMDPEHPHDNLDAVTVMMLPRYREVATEMAPYRQRQIYEGHPELSFLEMNGGVPMRYGRFTGAGHNERRNLLVQKMQGIERVLDVEIDRVKWHHLQEAAALMWSARRAFTRTARRIPLDPEWDSEGLRMEYVY
jgi:predicted RNase H-like nuclease